MVRSQAQARQTLENGTFSLSPSKFNPFDFLYNTSPSAALAKLRLTSSSTALTPNEIVNEHTIAEVDVQLADFSQNSEESNDQVNSVLLPSRPVADTQNGRNTIPQPEKDTSTPKSKERVHNNPEFRTPERQKSKKFVKTSIGYIGAPSVPPSPSTSSNWIDSRPLSSPERPEKLPKLFTKQDFCVLIPTYKPKQQSSPSRPPASPCHRPIETPPPSPTRHPSRAIPSFIKPVAKSHFSTISPTKVNDVRDPIVIEDSPEPEPEPVIKTLPIESVPKPVLLAPFPNWENFTSTLLVEADGEINFLDSESYSVFANIGQSDNISAAVASVTKNDSLTKDTGPRNLINLANPAPFTIPSSRIVLSPQNGIKVVSKDKGKKRAIEPEEVSCPDRANMPTVDRQPKVFSASTQPSLHRSEEAIVPRLFSPSVESFTPSDSEDDRPLLSSLSLPSSTALLGVPPSTANSKSVVNSDLNINSESKHDSDSILPITASSSVEKSIVESSSKVTVGPVFEEWDIKIVDEKGGLYRVHWYGEDVYGDPYPDTWEPTENVSEEAVAAWELTKEENAARGASRAARDGENRATPIADWSADEKDYRARISDSGSDWSHAQSNQENKLPTKRKRVRRRNKSSPRQRKVSAPKSPLELLQRMPKPTRSNHIDISSLLTSPLFTTANPHDVLFDNPRDIYGPPVFHRGSQTFSDIPVFLPSLSTESSISSTSDVSFAPNNEGPWNPYSTYAEKELANLSDEVPLDIPVVFDDSSYDFLLPSLIY